jgi:hypothetical protein
MSFSHFVTEFAAAAYCCRLQFVGDRTTLTTGLQLAMLDDVQKWQLLGRRRRDRTGLQLSQPLGAGELAVVEWNSGRATLAAIDQKCLFATEQQNDVPVVADVIVGANISDLNRANSRICAKHGCRSLGRYMLVVSQIVHVVIFKILTSRTDIRDLSCLCQPISVDFEHKSIAFK